jgi:CheY-like chemotaxis protein
VLSLRTDVPVIMMTGYARPKDYEDATRIGMRALITKPTSVDALCTIIDGIANGTSCEP